MFITELFIVVGNQKPLKHPHWGNRKTMVDIKHCIHNSNWKQTISDIHSHEHTYTHNPTWTFPEDIIDRKK